jgi:hypothetical protein
LDTAGDEEMFRERIVEWVNLLAVVLGFVGTMVVQNRKAVTGVSLSSSKPTELAANYQRDLAMIYVRMASTNR